MSISLLHSTLQPINFGLFLLEHETERLIFCLEYGLRLPEPINLNIPIIDLLNEEILISLLPLNPTGNLLAHLMNLPQLTLIEVLQPTNL
jgi:hypothetical protein